MNALVVIVGSDTIYTKLTVQFPTRTCGTYFTDKANSSSFTAVNTCEGYKCPDGYELKDDNYKITCTDVCDDEECCQLGGCVVPKQYTIAIHVLYQ